MRTCWSLGLMGLQTWILMSSFMLISVTVKMCLSCLLALWGMWVGAQLMAGRGPGLLTSVRPGASGVVGVGLAAGLLPLIKFPPCLLSRGCPALFLSRLFWILYRFLPQPLFHSRPLH